MLSGDGSFRFLASFSCVMHVVRCKQKEENFFFVTPYRRESDGGGGGGGKGPNQKRHFRGAGDRIGEFGRGKEEVLVQSPDLRSPEVGISAFVQSEKR